MCTLNAVEGRGHRRCRASPSPVHGREGYVNAGTDRGRDVCRPSSRCFAQVMLHQADRPICGMARPWPPHECGGVTAVGPPKEPNLGHPAGQAGQPIAPACLRLSTDGAQPPRFGGKSADDWCGGESTKLNRSSGARSIARARLPGMRSASFGYPPDVSTGRHRRGDGRRHRWRTSPIQLRLSTTATCSP